jgi:hypothetical protein
MLELTRFRGHGSTPPPAKEAPARAARERNGVLLRSRRVGTLIVVALRLTVPLVIFRAPLLGGVLALVVDTADLVVFNVFGFPDDYQRLDKALDLYYLTIELVVARRWAPLPRRVAGGLYAWRLVGAVLFEVTGARWVLLVFPNVFELWWLFVAAHLRFCPDAQLTGRRAASWLAVLLVPKLAHEFVLHVWRILDEYTLSEVATKLWPG